MADSGPPTPPSTERCPACSGRLVGERCADCELVLVGPAAARLWTIDVDLHHLTVERQALIRALRTGVAGHGVEDGHGAVPVTPAAAPPIQAPPGHPPPGRAWPDAAGTSPGSARPPDVPPPAFPPPVFPSPSFPPPDETWADGPGAAPVSAQTVLLGLGAFSLVVAAVVFLAVTWQDLSTAGKALTLLGITGLFGCVTTLVRRVSLTATAEALAAVTVMLGVADAYAVRVGLLADADTLVVWGGALAVLAASLTPYSAVLLGQALAVAAGVRAWRTRADPLVNAVLVAGAVAAWVTGAWLAGVLAVTGDGGRPVAALLLAVAGAVAAVAAWWWPEDDGLRPIGAGIATAGLVAATATLGSEWVHGEVLAIGTVALAAVIAVVATYHDRFWTRGPKLVGRTIAIAASAPSWPEMLATVDAPWSALGGTGAWQFGAGRPVRGVATFASSFESSFTPALVFLAILGVAAAATRRRVRERRPTDVLLAAVTGLGASVVPFALDLPVWAAAALVLGTMAIATPIVIWWSDHGRSNRRLAPWWALIVATGVHGLAWASLTPGLTPLGLAAVAAAASAVAALGVRRPDGSLAVWGASVAAAALAAAVPVTVVVLGAGPEVGWAVLGLLAPPAVLGSVLWARVDDPVRRRVAQVGGAVAAIAYAVAVAAIASLWDEASTAAGLLAATLAAGAAAAVAVAVVAVRSGAPVAAGAAAVATLLGPAAVAMAAVQAGRSPATGWLVFLGALAVASGVALVGEGRGTPADVLGAIDFVAGVGALAAIGAVGGEGSDDQSGVGLAIIALALAVAASRPSRRGAVVPAALVTVVLVWQRLAVAGVSTAEAYTLPAAVALAVAGGWTHRRSPQESSWRTWAPALLVGLSPSVLLSLGDPGLLRPIATVVAATAVLLTGSYLRRQAPFTIGAGALVLLGIEQLGPFVAELPNWVTFAAVGTILLAVGAGYERRRAQFVGLRSQYRDLR